MQARLFKSASLLMGTLLLLPGCGDIMKQNAVLTGGCTSAYRVKMAVINQVTNVTCSGTAATPNASTFPSTGTAYPTAGYPASTTGYPSASTQPIQGGQAVATPGGYAYQTSPTQANPYAGAVFPSGSYGTGYGSTNPYGNYPANPSATAGYGSTYGTAYGANTSYGNTYGTATQAGYGSTYGSGYGSGTAAYGSSYGTGTAYGTQPQTGYSSYAAPRTATQNAAQGTGYIQYNVNQAQQNQAKR